MKPFPHPSLFSSYGQRALGPELLTHLRMTEAAGDADASAELGSSYLDANGVDFDIDRAMQHFQKGAKAGNAFCQFKIAEHWFHSEYAENPQGTTSLKQNYDQIWSAAKGGVGEAYVALHFLHLRFRQSPDGYPSWVRREAESALAIFQTALRACYEYQDGGSADKCVNALEMLARDGFAPAYWMACIVSAVGCKDMARSQANLQAAVENGVPAAINHYVEIATDLPDSASKRSLLAIAAEHGHAHAFFTTLIEKKNRGQDEAESRAELLKFLRSSPRWFSEKSLSSLEFICLKARNLTDLPEARADADRVFSVLASLGRPNAISELYSRRFTDDMESALEHSERLDIEEQIALAKDMGKIFVAALSGSPLAWKSVMFMHLSGVLTGHGGVIRGGPKTQQAATAGLICGLISEKLSGQECVPEFIRNGFVSNGVRGVFPEFEQHVAKEADQIMRHRTYVGLMHRYGQGYAPSLRLLHECAAQKKAVTPSDYPWLTTYPPLRPTWPQASAHSSAKVSRSPFAKGWIHPKGIIDPACLTIRRHLDAGDIAAAKRCLRFDENIIPRLLTLAAGIYEAGYKLEASELLAYGIWNTSGQAGLAHHMLAWVCHESGRTTEAVRIALDSFEACECQPSSDTDVIEYNLLLAEMLMSLNRRDEAESAILRVKTQAAGVDAITDRCAQITTVPMYDQLAWSAKNEVGDFLVHYDQSNRAIRAISLSLTNMDRYRCVFSPRP